MASREPERPEKRIRLLAPVAQAPGSPRTFLTNQAARKNVQLPNTADREH